MFDRLIFPTIRKAAAQFSKSTPTNRNVVSKRDDRLSLARALGNQQFGALLQTKLAISQPGDAYEREADRVAEEITLMRDADITQAPWGQSVEDDDKIQRKAEQQESIITTSNPPSSSIGSGAPLNRDVRSYFEPRFHHDFSHVRIHTNRDAAEAARSLRSLAFTVGNDIVFAQNQYSFQRASGRKLLAHELTHVIQQTSAKNNFSNAIHSVPIEIQRYLSPLDIVDYIGLGYDLAERVYLTHFYEGSDKQFQLFLNTLFTAIDLAMAALPGVGGGGMAGRASHGALALAWNALPGSVKIEVAEKVAKTMAWSVEKTLQLINHEMLSAKSGEGGKKEKDTSKAEHGTAEKTGEPRKGISHEEMRARWQGEARKWFKENNIKSSGKIDQKTLKPVFEDSARGSAKKYYTVDQFHGQIEIFDYKLKHIGAIDIVVGMFFRHMRIVFSFCFTPILPVTSLIPSVMVA